MEGGTQERPCFLTFVVLVIVDDEKSTKYEVRNSHRMKKRLGSRAMQRFSGHWAALVGKRLGRGVYAREERSKRRINSPRFGRLKKYAGNCERPAAGRWLARDGSRRSGRIEQKVSENVSERLLHVRALLICEPKFSIWVHIFCIIYKIHIYRKKEN